MHHSQLGCEELRARTGNPPLDGNPNVFSVTSGENRKVPAFNMAESNWKHSFHVEQRRYYKQITAYCRTINQVMV